MRVTVDGLDGARETFLNGNSVDKKSKRPRDILSPEATRDSPPWVSIGVRQSLWALM